MNWAEVFFGVMVLIWATVLLIGNLIELFRRK